MNEQGKFALYVDDIGAGTPGLKDHFVYFGLGGILVERTDESKIRIAVRSFKTRWGIDEKLPLHGAEIRTMKKQFHWLSSLDEDKLVQFKTEIMELVLGMPIIVHGCIVHREGYYKRYYHKYDRKTWDMRISAAAILLERCAKFVQSIGGSSLEVYFERCGNSEDNIFKATYADLRAQGHPFDEVNAEKYSPLNANAVEKLLAPKPHARTKENELLQIADLCLFPLTNSRNGKPNIAFENFLKERKIVDVLTPDRSIHTKFYCFDS